MGSLDASTRDEIERAARVIARGSVVVLTGAGMSVDSGIPDFRSAGGIWDRYPPDEFATIDAFVADPVRVWGFFRELGEMLEGARPNAGHEVIARLEARGLVDAVITQNIDGLHQRAGSRRVIELHGSGENLHCLACARVYPAIEPRFEDLEAPRCDCGHILKPQVVLFGELLPERAMADAAQAIQTARSCLVCGTSSLVFPAADLPRQALSAGLELVEVNLERTALSRREGVIHLEGRLAEILPLLEGSILQPR